MANPEHLAKLEEGVEAWNKWREENPDIREPDLREAILRRVTSGRRSSAGRAVLAPVSTMSTYRR